MTTIVLVDGKKRGKRMSSAAVKRVPPTAAVPTPSPVLADCVIILRGEEIRIPASAHTLQGFREWCHSDEFPEEGRITFLDNEIILDMDGEELQTHSKVKMAISYTLYGLNDELDLGEFYPDDARVVNEGAGVSNRPDAVLVTWQNLDSGRVRLVPRKNHPDQYREVEGSPDWILEIVSDSSVTKDTRRLRRAYHRAGIREYWLVDARGEEIEFQILLHEPGDYVAAPVLRGGWQRSRVFGRSFRLQRRRGRMQLWQYTLEVKPAR